MGAVYAKVVLLRLQVILKQLDLSTPLFSYLQAITKRTISFKTCEGGRTSPAYAKRSSACCSGPPRGQDEAWLSLISTAGSNKARTPPSEG